MPLFLFNRSNRRLYGVFEAASDGGYNIDPFVRQEAEQSKSSSRHTTLVSKYPAQVRVAIKAQRPALVEELFRPYLDNEEGSEFKLELSASQVQQLLYLFETAQAAIKECRFLERNRVNRKVRHDLESPRSTAEADLDSYSDSSSRGLSSCEDECTDEPACVHQCRKAGKVVRQRLHQIALVRDDHSHGRAQCIPPVLEDCVCPDHCNNIQTWKRATQRPARGCDSDSNRVSFPRLQETDPAVNSTSDHCLESGVGQSPALCNGDDDITLPIMSLPQPQFFVHKEPYQQKENACLPGQSIRSKRSDQKKVLRGRLMNSYKPGFNQDRSHKPKLPQSAPMESPGPQLKEVFSDLCFQGHGQAQQDPAQLPAPLSPSSMPPTNKSHTLGWQQMGVESAQELGVTELMHLTPEELQNLQNGHTSHHLMPPVLARPMAAPPPITAGFVEALHFEVLEFARRSRPSSEVQSHVVAAIDCVRKGVKTVWPEADVEVYGSFATGLCLQHSDVDLVVIDASPKPSAEDALKAQAPAFLIRELATALKTYEWCESINPLDTASMPVLKCLCRPFTVSADTPSTIASVAVDITIGGTRNSHSTPNPAAQAPDVADQVARHGMFDGRHTGAAAREYVFRKIQELPALAPLVLLLKAFLHHQNLSDVYMGGLGSFSLTLLVTFFLERVAITNEVFSHRSSGDLLTSCTLSPALPCALELPDDSNVSDPSCCFGASNWDCRSDCRCHSLGERYVKRAADAIERVLSLWEKDSSPYLGTLLLGFLQTFGAQLDLSREKIVLNGIDGSPGGFCKREDRHIALWIDDPLRPGVNIGGGSFGMVHVQKAFRDMLQLLLQNPVPFSPLQCKDNCCQDLAAMTQLTHIGCVVRGG